MHWSWMFLVVNTVLCWPGAARTKAVVRMYQASSMCLGAREPWAMCMQVAAHKAPAAGAAKHAVDTHCDRQAYGAAGHVHTCSAFAVC